MTDVRNALEIILPKGLASNSILEGQKAVDNYMSENLKGSSRQEKSRIVFPPSITEKFLRKFGHSSIMVTKNSPVYFAGALEYLVVEILENASTLAKNSKHVRITIRDLQLGIYNDDDLYKFF